MAIPHKAEILELRANIKALKDQNEKFCEFVAH
jgi:hypothetical protein